MLSTGYCFRNPYYFMRKTAMVFLILFVLEENYAALLFDRERKKPKRY
jgi:hypothetical protein